MSAGVQNDKGVRSVQSGVDQTPLIVIQEQRYHLNPSKSKWISIGRAYQWSFHPVINISGLKNNGVTLNEEDWYEILNQEGVITNFFFSDDIFHSISANSVCITFERFPDFQTIKIEDRWRNVVYLGKETVLKLFQLAPLIAYTINMLKTQEFNKYFNTLVQDVRTTNMDVRDFVIQHISDLPHSENIRTAMELAYQHPNLKEFNKAPTLKFYSDYPNYSVKSL
ncbi:unnamed protein product [Acanthoscelides obtectus]|uniref:Uncharacterized protein n=1 Tax=Acanthoscelides obtectus TaxID=200917 RepID=A0A9P0QAL1_ACAOB|nr:unnamed protein product [Acanthoscelides obtectus]CAH2015833.1 unnamed protein product [Acanthoscelides obtectus]CAH2018316.1 unnamed protein product [Acanthoscelides obtectus]CAH2021387.1 unnamed protein product [Acanthoscelides obtectus]CAK1623317.1 hypothetical protein AOBTE_LOCUS1926 [Acanthoscelides obtectus]